jgi:hypothetical protein
LTIFIVIKFYGYEKYHFVILVCFCACVDSNEVILEYSTLLNHENHIQVAKEWFTSNHLSQSPNSRATQGNLFDHINWENAIEIILGDRIFMEVPLHKNLSDSYRYGKLEKSIPLKRNLVIIKDIKTNVHSYSIVEFIPFSEFLFVTGTKVENLSIKSFKNYSGALISRNLKGDVINGYLFDNGKIAKMISGESKNGGKNKYTQCMSFTVNFYVDVCSIYGCWSSFDFSQTFNFCFEVTNQTELASVDPYSGGYGSGSSEEPIITTEYPYPSGADLHARLGQSFETDYTQAIQSALNGRFCSHQMDNLLSELFIYFPIDRLNDNISVMNYPAGHPHNRSYIYGFGIKIGKASDPEEMGYYEYNGDNPTFSPDSPYGSVLNPGRYGIGPIKLTMCSGNDEWWVSYHFLIKETI